MTYANAQEVWNALNNTSNVNEMRTILQASIDDGIKLNSSDLFNFANAKTVVINGATRTVLYGGYVIGPDGNKIFNSDIANLMASNDTTLAVIDKSEAGKLAFSNEFKGAFELALGGEDAFQRVYSGNVPALNADGTVQVDSTGKTIYVRSTDLTISTSSLADTLSARFVEVNPHNYIILSENSNPFNTTNVTEIPKILNMEDSVINNIPRDKIAQIHEYVITHGGTEADARVGEISAILTSARENGIQNLDLVLNPDGTPARVGTATHPIPEGTPGKFSYAEIVPPLDIFNTATFRIGSELLAKVGIGLVAISGAVAVYDATVAYNEGDHAHAAQILADWAAGTGGGLVLGGALGGAAAIGTEAWLSGLAALGGAGGVEALFLRLLLLGPPGQVAAGIVLVSATLFGVAGFIAGTEAGQDLLHKFEQLGINAYDNTVAFAEHLSDIWRDVHTALDDAIENAISNAAQLFFDSVAAALVAPPTRTDPLIIDLAGNGIELDSFQTSAALFDLNGDGTPENTGWTKTNSDDSFLVIDKNNNGNIDDITEMFGSATVPGFVELKKYDSNGDNLINSTDSQFSLLKLWNDANANGIVDAGEMTTLAANNITEISLNSYSRFVEIEGNLQTAISSVTMNGVARNIHELSFAFETPILDISNNPDLTLPADFHLSIESIVLPYSRGYRTLHSWQAAMTLDPILLAMAQDMMRLTPADLYKINDKFEDFLFRWADVENVTAADVYATGGDFFDPRKVAFMEKITGADFLHLNAGSAALAAKAWDLFFNDFLGRFLAQGNLHAAFPNASYDFATDTLNIGSNLDEVIANIESFAETMDLNSFVNFAYYAKNILELNKSQFNDADFDAKVDGMLEDVIGAVDVAGFTFDGRLNIGGNYNDVLGGSAKNDVLNGQDGNDELYGFAGNDYIVGGKGDDLLVGAAGNDIYRFSIGDGQDTIEDNAGVDKILLGDSITLADLSFAQVGSDIIINIGADDKIAIKNFYNTSTNRVEKIEFNDGSSFNLQNIGAIVYGDDFANSLNGTAIPLSCEALRVF